MSQEAKEMDNAERLAIVETELKQLNKMMTNINDKLDVWNQNYVPRNEINVMFEQRDKSIKNVDAKFEAAEQNKFSLRRMWPAWLGVGIAALSFLKDII